jgi:hypothetical protein
MEAEMTDIEIFKDRFAIKRTDNEFVVKTIYATEDDSGWDSHLFDCTAMDSGVTCDFDIGVSLK